MSRGTKNLVEGAVTLPVGLALYLFTDDVKVLFFDLTKVGVVLMFVGAAMMVTGLVQRVTASRISR
ncbi:DUF5708 family protein [Streptomyces sp. NPDC051561]|uniref:DUF5708 family protein n=1 Tax=Streptomyces sp. NPDC051561 TaxID=3365658 RepID=UPI0037B80D0E